MILQQVFKCSNCKLTVVNRKVDQCPKCRQPVEPWLPFNADIRRDPFTAEELRVVLAGPEDFQNPARNDIAAVTSLSVRRHSLDRQKACIASWQRFGLQVFVRNTEAEIEQLQAEFPSVTFIQDDDTCSCYAYPTQKIRNLARTAIELSLPVLVINSDCELRGPAEWLQFSESEQFIGVRWDHDKHKPQELTEFRWGLDAFSFTPQQAAMLPADFLFAIGHAVWDYAVPAVMRRNGVRLSIPHRPLMFHQCHPINWTKEDWHTGAGWMRKRLGIAMQWGEPTFREQLDPDWRYSKTRWVKRNVSSR